MYQVSIPRYGIPPQLRVPVPGRRPGSPPSFGLRGGGRIMRERSEPSATASPDRGGELRRELLELIAWYLRVCPIGWGKDWLLGFCRRHLSRRLRPFGATVSLTRHTARAPVRLRCFQLGGVNHADILSEWLLYAGCWQPALTHWLCRSLAAGDTFADVRLYSSTVLATAVLCRPLYLSTRREPMSTPFSYAQS